MKSIFDLPPLWFEIVITAIALAVGLAFGLVLLLVALALR